MISCNDFCMNFLGVKPSRIRVPKYPIQQQSLVYTNNQVYSSTDIDLLEDFLELQDEPVDSCTHKENSLSNPIQSTRTPIKELETEMLFPTPLPTDGDKLLNCHSPQPMVVIPMEQLMSPSLENKVLLEDEFSISSSFDSDPILRVNNKKEEELLQLCSQRKLEETNIGRLRQLALDEEVDPNCKDLNNCPPVVLLCRYNRSTNLALCVQTLLLRNSVFINSKDRMGFNALITVCYWHNGTELVDVVNLLLEGGIDVNAVTHHERWNALFALIFNRRGNFSSFLRITQALVEYGLNLNATIDGSNVLMHLATSTRLYLLPDFFNVIQFLIERGIFVNLKDADGRNALSCISDQYHGPQLIEIVQILIDAGSEIVPAVNDSAFDL